MISLMVAEYCLTQSSRIEYPNLLFLFIFHLFFNILGKPAMAAIHALKSTNKSLVLDCLDKASAFLPEFCFLKDNEKFAT